MNGWNDITVLAPAGDIDISTAPGAAQPHRYAHRTGFSARHTIARMSRLSIPRASPVWFRARGRLAVAQACSRWSTYRRMSCASCRLGVWPRRFTLPLPSVPRCRSLHPMRVLGGVRACPLSKASKTCLIIVTGIVEMLSTLPMSEGDRFDYALAVGEALSNAYDHADGAHGCTMTVAAYDDRVVTILRDCGCGYEISDDDARRFPSCADAASDSCACWWITSR